MIHYDTMRNRRQVDRQKLTHAENFRGLLTISYILFFVISMAWSIEFWSIFWLTLISTSLSLYLGPFGILMPDRKLYDPATLFNSATFYYLIKGLPISWGEIPPHLYQMSYNSIVQRHIFVIVATAAGLLMWNLGYHWVLRRRQSTDRTVEATSAEPILQQRKTGAGVVILTLVGLLSLVLLSRSLGGDLFSFLLNPLTRSYLSDAQYGAGAGLGFFWLYGTYMLPVASMPWLVVIVSNSQRPDLGWWAHVTLSLFVIFVLSPRAVLLSFVISLLIQYHLSVRRIQPIWIALFGISGVVYSYFINSWRSITGRGGIWSITQGLVALPLELSPQGIFRWLGGTDLSDIRMFVLVADAYGRTLPLKYGETLLRLFTQLVPRTIWPSKPPDLGTEIGQLFAPGTLSGTPPGFFAEMYMNFHLVGVIGGCLLLGAGLAWFYRRSMVESNSFMSLAVYALVAPRIFLLVSSTFANVVLVTLILVAGIVIAFKMSPTVDRQ